MDSKGALRFRDDGGERDRDDAVVVDLRRISKLRHIEKRPGQALDIVGRLKATAFGKFYAHHLKRYSFVRALVNWTWRNSYPLYVSIATQLLNRKTRGWRRLIKLGESVKVRGAHSFRLAPSAIVATPAPQVFPACDQDYLVSPHDCYTFPEIYVATVSEALVYGGTNLTLLDNDEVICHDLYDFERDYTSEELHGRDVVDGSRYRIRWMQHDKEPEWLPAAASFVDACAPNYAHWLTEVLPRIAMFCAEAQFKSIPIVVNDELHENIMESLFLIAGPDREILALPIGRALKVGTLYVTSVAGYVPFERRNSKLTGHSHGLFSPRAFELIRARISSFAESGPSQAWPEKIYLRRSSGTRRVTNSTDLEELLIPRGFMIVEPEKLTFLEQAQLFGHAKTIVGSSGAALANILLAPASAKILILISKWPDTSYWYWQNIACASGNTVRYIFGEPTGTVKGIHSDFAVDLKEVLREIGEEL